MKPSDASRGKAGLAGRLNLARRPYLPAIAVCALLFILNGVLQPRTLRPESIVGDITTYLPMILLAVGQTYVVFVGDIDLSVGSIISLVNVVTVSVMAAMGDGVGAILAGVSAGMLVGALCGAFNGFFVAVLRFQPIVATFAAGIVFAGLALWVLPSAGLPTPDAYWETYGENLAGVPFVLWVLAGIAAVVGLIANLVFQRSLLAVGGHRESAYQSGLPVARLRVRAYILCGAFAALAALCLTGDTGSGDPLLGAKSTLGSVAAVVLGGTALSGGRGSAVGSIFGAVILGLAGSFVFFAGVPFEYQNLVQGLIVLGALAGGVAAARR
ncbi:MAG: ABC transporter permease [Desulfobacterales bacterium]|nr:ABC transporter permease [Desulfobacterales bacterium]